MATHTIGGQRWSDGTTVSVYPAAAWPDPSRAPSGSAVATAAVSGGAVTFTNLADRVRYVAYAAGVGVTFMVPKLNPMDARSLRDRVDDLDAEDSIVNWSTVVTAGGSGVDAYAALQAAVAAAETAASSAVYSPGAATARVVLGDGLHDMLSGGGLQFTPDNAGTRGWVEIVWAPGAVMRLSPSCPRAVEFHRSADYDIFRKVRLIRPTIDGNGVVVTSDNSIIGSVVNNVQAQRVSFEDIDIDDLHVYNAPAVGPTNGKIRAAVWLATTQPGVPSYPEPTQQTVKRIRVRRPRVYGCDFGIIVTAHPVASAPNGVNVFFEDIVVEDPIVELNNGAAPASYGGPQGGVQICNAGFGTRCRVTNPVVKYSSDIGVEINAMQDAVITNPDLTNCKNGIYWNNYHPASDPATQKLTIYNHHSRITSAWTLGSSWGLKTGTTNPLGHLRIVGDFKHEQDGQSTAGMTSPVGQGLYVQTVSIRSVDIDRFDCVATNAAVDNTVLTKVSLLDIASTYVGCRVRIGRLDSTLQGTRTATATTNYRIWAIALTDGTLQIDALGGEINMGGTATAFAQHLLTIGDVVTGIATTTLRARIRSFVPRACVGDSNPRPLRIFAGTVVNGTLPLSDSDFSALAGAGTSADDITTSDATTLAKLVIRSTKFRTAKLSIAAAATLTIPDIGAVEITGNTNITAITALPGIGGPIALKFTGTPTVTAGATIKTAAAANFVATADDVLTLLCDGTNWYEVARSVNA